MKKLLYFLVFLPVLALAESPLYHHKEANKQLEFENVYKEITESNTKSSLNLSKSSATATYLTTSSATATYVKAFDKTYFIVTNTNAQNDVTGDGSQPVVQFDSEVMDGLSGHFSANTFTATLGGLYQFNGCVFLKGFAAAHTSMAILVVTSNRNYQNIDNSIDTATNKGMCISVLADMDAGDTADLRVRVSGSTKVVDIDNDPTGVWFSGFMIR